MRFNLEMLTNMQRIYNFDLDKVLKITNLGEFYEKFTCKIYEENSIKEFYKKHELTKEHIQKITKPTLILNSKDDKMCRNKFVLKSEIVKNSNIVYVETEVGGHVCWLSGKIPYTKPWYNEIIISYLDLM